MSGGLPRSLRPRRDRAMMLLASVLGMRAGDTEAPGLSDIGRRARAAPLARRKTQVANAPRMPEEVWLAVADHVRCERPDVDGDRVLVTACAPYHAIDSSHTSRGTVTRAFADAGVETAGERHGTRGPAAGDMPPGGTPYPTTSSVLGHSSANVTERHPSVDAGSPRPPAPGVPSCPWGPGSREGAPRPWEATSPSARTWASRCRKARRDGCGTWPASRTRRPPSPRPSARRGPRPLPPGARGSPTRRAWAASSCRASSAPAPTASGSGHTCRPRGR